MTAPAFIVTPAAVRPAGPGGQCFHCHKRIGLAHDPDCITVRRMVRVRMIVEYDISVPAHWGKGDVEFNRNDGTWCADNALDELAAIDPDGCICDRTRFEYIGDAGEPFLSE